MPQHPVTDDQRVPLPACPLPPGGVDSGGDTPGRWLEHLVDGVPATGSAGSDDYRTLLRSALLDARLSSDEIEQLIATAHQLGISREEAVELHGDHLRQLAVEAWADGVVTAEERERMHDIALQLGVDAHTVDMLLAEPVAGQVEGIDLGPGDRVSFTGALELGRDDWGARARAAGLSVGAVTRSSALLVSATPDSMSGKARLAREYGVPIIDEITFARILSRLEGGGAPAPVPGEETAPSHAWYVEVFPWWEEIGGVPGGVDDIAEAWMVHHPSRPLFRLSPRLQPETFPDGVGPDGVLAARWLAAHPAPLHASCRDLADLPGFGRATLSRMISAVVLAALDARDPEPGADPGAVGGSLYVDDWASAELYVPGPTTPAADPADGPGAALRTVAEWQALTEGPFRPARQHLPAPVAEALDRLAVDPFWADPAASAVRRARGEIATAVGVDPRDVDIFRDRLLGNATLDALGARHGVTRERIRQLEGQLKKRLADPGPATRLVTTALSLRFGPLRPRSDLLRDLPVLGEDGPVVGRNMLRTLSLFIADRELTERWFQRAGFNAELAAALDRLADDYGVVALRRLSEDLAVDVEQLRRRLAEESETTLKLLGDHVLTRVGSYGDRAAAVLAIAGQPLTVGGIFDRYGGGNLRSAANALANHPQIIRVGREEWALAEWGGEEYTTLADWIARRVDSAGTVALDDLIAEATRDLGVTASSVRTYASTVEFRLEDGMVSRAEEIEHTPADPAESAGLYTTDDGWALLVTVNHDHLRGSGSGVPKGIATVLDLPILEKRALGSPLGPQMVHHSRTGVALGSVRRFLQALGSAEGDRVWLTFARDGRFDVVPASPRREGLTGLAEVLNRTGLDDRVTAGAEESEQLAVLNEAVGLRADAPRRRTVSRFRHRRQDDLADLVAAL